MGSELVSGILFLAPGFLALKLFHLLGAQRPRSQWEWTTWSVIASLPINGVTSVLRDQLALQMATPNALEISIGLLVGVAFGSVAAYTWQVIRRSPRDMAGRIRMAIGTSAWDEALEDAQRAKRQVELVLHDGKRYLGTICYGGREDNEAEGWVYLIYPEVYDESIGRFRDAKGTHGYLIHRDRIKRLRVLLTKTEPDPQMPPKPAIDGSGDPTSRAGRDWPISGNRGRR